MTNGEPQAGKMYVGDDATAALVRLAAVIAVGSSETLREGMARALAKRLEPVWVEELILQSYLFVGFPRALNAAREWRRSSGLPAASSDSGSDYGNTKQWKAEGEVTCSTVYGDMYDALRANIRALHPALDSWMIVEGYGKVMSRPNLDLKRRELCIVAVCAVTQQERQLHSHLHGSVNAGATEDEVWLTLDVASEFVHPDVSARWRQLWSRVRVRR